MNILITGNTGFLGREITLHTSTHSIFSLNRSEGKYKCDLSNSIPHFNEDFDVVIHNAGKAHTIPRTFSEKNSYFQVNVQGLKNLLEGLEKKSVKQFVFISSVAVYGMEHGLNVNEYAPLLAKDPYGLSKIQAEKLVLEWCKNNDVVCTILRLPLLVGKNPPGNLGTMLNAIKKGYYFNIGGGTAKKSMVLAQDVAKFIPIIRSIGGIYNLTDGEHPTFAALSTAIAKNKIPNLPLFIAKIFGRIGDLIGNISPINSLKVTKITSDLTFDDSKARAMGWNPQSVLEFLKTNRL